MTTPITLEKKADRDLYAVGSDGQFWDVWKNERDEWFERCDGHSTLRCLRCGGARAIRLAGSERGLKMAIRNRVRIVNGELNAVERKEQTDVQRAYEWARRNPNLAWDLARIRADSSAQRDPLRSIAVNVTTRPPTPAAVHYAVSVLVGRAWDEANVETRRTYVGTVGERLTVTGTVRTSRPLRPFYVGADGPTLVILDVYVENAVAPVRIVSAAAWAANVEPGQVLTVEGVVHTQQDDMRYGPQTALSWARAL